MIYPHPVTVHPSVEALDPDGNTVRRPAPVGTPALAYVQPVTSAIDIAAGQGSETRHVAYLDPAAPRLDAFSALDWDGQRYETVGAALRFTDPDDTVTYWRVTLRQVGP